MSIYILFPLLLIFYCINAEITMNEWPGAGKKMARGGLVESEGVKARFVISEGFNSKDQKVYTKVLTLHFFLGMYIMVKLPLFYSIPWWHILMTDINIEKIIIFNPAQYFLAA